MKILKQPFLNKFLKVFFYIYFSLLAYGWSLFDSLLKKGRHVYPNANILGVVIGVFLIAAPFLLLYLCLKEKANNAVINLLSILPVAGFIYYLEGKGGYRLSNFYFSVAVFLICVHLVLSLYLLFKRIETAANDASSIQSR